MTSMSSRIVAVEPLMAGYAHSKLNAGLLSMLAKAFPEDVIHFHAESRHLDFVRAAAADLPNLEWHSISIPPDTGPEGFRRVPGEWAWLREFRRALRGRPRLGLVCAYSQLSLAFTKLSLRFFPTGVPVYGILHSILKSVGAPPRGNMFRRTLSPASTLRWRHPANLRHLALGPSIVSSVKATMPEIVHQFDCIPKPWLWPQVMRTAQPPGSRDDIVFGLIGGSGARLQEGALVAREFRRYRPTARCRFKYVGSAPPDIGEPLRDLLGPISSNDLTDEAFARQLSQVTYVIGLNSGPKYAFVASGAFHDALCFGKPGVHLSTAYVKERSAALGDVGEVVENMSAMVTAVVRSYDEYDASEYAIKSRQILASARQHDPEVVAPRFRAIYENRFRSWHPGA